MDIDGISTLEERFNALPAGAKVSLSLKFDPHGDRVVYPPLRGIRRDETLEVQLFAYLTQHGGQDGLYLVQLRESGRVVCTQEVPVKILRAHEAPVLPATPAATPGATPAPTPLATPEEDPEQEFFRKLYQKTVREALAARFEPPAPQQLDEPDYEEDEPPQRGAVQVLESAMASPVFGPVLAKLTEALAEVVQGHAGVMAAKSRLYEARAVRNGAPERAATAPRSARVMGLRPVRIAPPPATGGKGAGSA